MYAVIRTGGKQYRVEAGDVVHVERLSASVGASITLDDVLLIGDESTTRIGAPRLENASVLGTVVEQARSPKVRIFKYKKRKHYRRTKGHRQSFTAVRIDRVQA